jgi:hypothetical protein
VGLSRRLCILVLRLLLGVLAFAATPSMAATCSQATSQGTAPSSWQTYCWLDFSTYVDATARTVAGQNFVYTLSDGATLTFNVKTTGPAITSIAAPSWTGAAVGNTAFLGIPGRPILYQQASGSSVITISSILITPPPGAPAVTAYMFVSADAESTDNTESLRFVTNGGNWILLDSVDPISGSQYPTQTGIGTNTFNEAGAGLTGNVGGYIVGSTSPTTVTTTLNGGGLQGAMFAVRFASMRLTKVITGARINAADQFKFDIAATSSGSVLASGTTSGTGNGPFQAAAVSLASGIPLTLTEAMATGSVSALSKYSSRLTCTNGTTGSSTVLPNNVQTTSHSFGALQFGDAIACTFTNAPYPHINLVKALGTGGRLFNTDQFTVNLAQGATTIATTTTTGTGTTVSTGAIGPTQVTAGTAYGLDEAAAGSTTLSQYTATMACTNAATGSTTTLPTATPGSITPVLGDVITCTITNTKKTANATLTVVKSLQLVSDPANGATNPKAIPGAVVNYAITVANTGSLAVDSSSIFILDPLPAPMTYNSGSPVVFTNGNPVSGLTQPFNAATDVKFSNSTTGAPATFAACIYTPSGSYDANVKYVCIRPSGVMAGGTGAGQPSFTVTFQTQIK